MASDWVTLIKDGDVAGLRRWLNTGGRISAKDQYNWSPLDHAVEQGRWEVVQLLLNRGGSVTQAFKFALERNRYDVAHRLLPLGVKTKVIQEALAQSSPHFWSNRELLLALLEAGADINHVDTCISNGNTPLHFAAAAGQIDAVKLLLTRGARPNAKNDRGKRPVDLASDKGHAEVARVLAAAKISRPTSVPLAKAAPAAKTLNLKGVKIRRSAQALTEAELEALEEKLGISLPEDYRVFLLLHNGGVPDLADFRFRLDDQESSEGISEGHVTWFYPVTASPGTLAGECDLETIYNNFKGSALPRRMLPIASAEADPDGGDLCISVQGTDRGQIYFRPDVDSSEETVYRVADSFPAFLATLAKERHPKPDWVTAIQDGNLDAVRRWLDAGGRLTVQHRGQDPLRLAVAEGNLEIVQLLLTRGASISEAYMHAKDKAQNVILRYLLKAGAAKEISDHELFLHSEKLWNDLELIRALVEGGADLNYRSYDGTTPLHLAAQHAPADVVRFLLQRGAKTGVWNNQFQTPLHRAVFTKDPKELLTKMKLLIDAGEDLHARPPKLAGGLRDVLARVVAAVTSPKAPLLASAADFLAEYSDPKILQELEAYVTQKKEGSRKPD